MGGTNDVTVEQQLLMSAAVLRLGPDTDLGRANTARVVDQVLGWRGLNAERVRSGWREQDCDPTHEAVYSALVRMIHQTERKEPGMPLFEGGGNWGVPGDPDQPACWPQYNSCRLTAEGERLARLLLDLHPEYRKSAEGVEKGTPKIRAREEVVGGPKRVQQN